MSVEETHRHCDEHNSFFRLYSFQRERKSFEASTKKKVHVLFPHICLQAALHNDGRRKDHIFGFLGRISLVTRSADSVQFGPALKLPDEFGLWS